MRNIKKSIGFIKESFRFRNPGNIQKIIKSIKNITFSSKIHKKAPIILKNPLCFENYQKNNKKSRKSGFHENDQKRVDFIKESFMF